MYLIDSHCHLDMLNYESKHQDYADVIRKANENNVKTIIQICCTLERHQKYYSQLLEFPNIFFSVGVHPLYIDDVKLLDINLLKQLAIEDKVVAIGECGLDGYYSRENIDIQKNFFIKQINIANELHKPLVIHSRGAPKETIEILSNHKNKEISGVVHCFTENLKVAKQILDLGMYIGIGGIITFNKAEELREIVKYIPLDRILLETDSPYLAPVPYRGKENEPGYVSSIAKFISELKKTTYKEIAQVTTNNVKKLFKI